MITIYQIKKISTGDSYIGSTSGWPFGRWTDHFSTLQRNKHHSKPFQEAYVGSDLSDWQFNILESNVPTANRFIRERHWYELVQPTLNGTSHISKAIARDVLYDRADDLISQGISYRKISAELGCSIGWLSNRNRRFIDGPV